MSLAHALLTSLLEKPCSGLDLARRFQRSIGFFWPASHQLIYKELGKLESLGWVVSVAEEGARGRKRVYQVLPTGRTELLRWVADTEEPTPLRDALMVRLRAEAVLGANSGAVNDLNYRLATHKQKLALYQEIEQRDFAGRELSRAEQLQYLVLQSGLVAEASQIELCEKGLALLNKLDS
ncbi:PadR family transcriptional regulator [Agitococcus lubricus]|uniref:PadR family transcriptional regulator n=1 Tax=Agitococcus lubricus TaxID=1077255 RepID=A0A2T5IY26_9GAMM|nr:PadR family transcriptional regulator [Agitococcus lubricus]PTQ88873.1 PadR family transcriptional regulator [Agitococcus lubricus]